MSPTVILVGIVMVLALIGMIACAKKQRTNPNAQPVAIVLLVIVIACGITIMIKTGSFGGDDTASLIENETKFACAKSTILGKYLKEKFAGEKVLVIADRDFEKNKRTQRLVDSIKAGLGADVVVDTIAIENKGAAPQGGPGGEEFMMPLEEIMTAKDFDATVEKHPDCKIIVTMVGLPRDAAKMKLWKMSSSSRPKVALLDGGIQALKNVIASSYIVAAVSYKPGIKYTEDPAPSDVQKAFDERYILITPENINDTAEKYKALFQ